MSSVTYPERNQSRQSGQAPVEMSSVERLSERSAGRPNQSATLPINRPSKQRAAGANAAALRLAPTPALALPHLGKEIPKEVLIERDQHFLADLAQVMVKEGILTDADWHGNLIDSVQAAFVRWVNVELGAQHNHFLLPSFVYSDQLSELGFHVQDLYYMQEMREDNKGGFGLEADGYIEAEVGLQVEFYNSLFPGLGSCLLGLLEKVWDDLCFAVTPSWVNGVWFGEVEAEDAEDEYVSSLREVIPDAAINCCFDPPLFQKARQTPLSDQAEQTLAIGSRLIEAHTTLLALARQPNEIDTYPVEVHPLLLIHWKDDDPMGRYMDDLGESYGNAENSTTLNFLRTFDPTDLKSMKQALQRMKQALKTLVLSDQLLCRLDLVNRLRSDKEDNREGL